MAKGLQRGGRAPSKGELWGMGWSLMYHQGILQSLPSCVPPNQERHSTDHPQEAGRSCKGCHSHVQRHVCDPIWRGGVWHRRGRRGLLGLAPLPWGATHAQPPQSHSAQHREQRPGARPPQLPLPTPGGGVHLEGCAARHNEVGAGGGGGGAARVREWGREAP